VYYCSVSSTKQVFSHMFWLQWYLMIFLLRTF